MHIIDRGNGDPIIAVPGIQGRWEYLGPTVDALSTSARVVTFSLCDEPAADARGSLTRGIDAYAEQIALAMDDRGLDRAVICGVSFGGLAALRFAARWPARTTALVLVSAPGPLWHLKPRHETYARWPLVFGPAFLIETPWRLRSEMSTALPGVAARARFMAWQLRTLVTAPPSLGRMARRALLISDYDRIADCASVSSPTLIVHGDPQLDHVVEAGGTREYAGLIREAQTAELLGTGHLGSITRPHEFAQAVQRFLNRSVRGARDSAA